MGLKSQCILMGPKSQCILMGPKSQCIYCGMLYYYVETVAWKPSFALNFFFTKVNLFKKTLPWFYRVLRSKFEANRDWGF